MATRSTLPTFTSHTTRTRGGAGFYSDSRTNSRLEEMGCTEGETLLPGELRSYSKHAGDGQRFDFFSVVECCAKCRKESAVNIVSLCGDCAREEAQQGTTQASNEAAAAELTALFLAAEEAAEREIFEKAEAHHEETRMDIFSY